jgi:hypothetical protein
MTERTQSHVDAEEVDGNTPLPSERRIRLETVDHVRVEMARVYREVRNGKLAPELGGKLTWMLVQLARVNEVVTVERRLREIEDRLKRGGPGGLEHEA